MFLNALRTQYRDLFDGLDSALVNRYLDREGYFCDPKPSEGRRNVEQAAEDLYLLVTEYSRDARVSVMETYGTMKRLLSEQCEVSDTGAVTLILKPSSDSLQNPSDPDAGYSGHKGKGYQIQVCESSHDENPFEVVTHAKLESANESDSGFVEELISDIDQTHVKPEELLADTSYGSQDNVDFAKDHGVDLISPASGLSRSDGITLDDFEFSEDGRKLLTCAHGQEPESQRFRKNKGYGTAQFDIASQCQGCPFEDQCPGKDMKNGKRRFKWQEKAGKLSSRRRLQKQAEFKEKYKKRSGIEATFSQLKNTHGGNDLHVRGFPSVMGVSLFKLIAINVRRFSRYDLEQQRSARELSSVVKTGLSELKMCLNDLLFRFEQRILKLQTPKLPVFTEIREFAAVEP